MLVSAAFCFLFLSCGESEEEKRARYQGVNTSTEHQFGSPRTSTGADLQTHQKVYFTAKSIPKKGPVGVIGWLAIALLWLWDCKWWVVGIGLVGALLIYGLRNSNAEESDESM